MLKIYPSQSMNSNFLNKNSPSLDRNGVCSLALSLVENCNSNTPRYNNLGKPKYYGQLIWHA